MSELRVALSNCSPDEAPSLARQLVESRLAACVNIIPAVRSIYIWEGDLCDDAEATLLIKTTAQRYPELESKLLELHSYDTPEIVALEPTDVLDSYLAWAKDQT